MNIEMFGQLNYRAITLDGSHGDYRRYQAFPDGDSVGKTQIKIRVEDAMTIIPPPVDAQGYLQRSVADQTG